MTQEQKDLLLKDLCARLPYGVKVNEDIQGVFTLIGLTTERVFTTCEVESCHNDFPIENIKPYLFPFSSMTEEQKEELNAIFDMDVEIAISHIKNDTPNFFTGLNRLNWFIKNHFDIYGLIPMGLANDATGLNIY